MLNDLELRVEQIATDFDRHTCREDGYDPYRSCCPMCVQQLHALSALNAAHHRTTRRLGAPMPKPKKIDHHDAWNVACHRSGRSNLARSYVELRVALARLEDCCEAAARCRSQLAYLATIATRDGSDALLSLDAARNFAREILSAVET